ncbi:RTA1 like protein, partial [Jaminaea rosea]
YGPYGYQPKLAPAVVFTVVYALLALVHLGLTVKSRQWWLIVLALGAGFETAGNALRIYGHFYATVTDPYIAMQVLVVVTPAFFAAIHFAILGKVLILFGRKFCFVPPKLIIPFFVTLDVASLAIQGGGSGIAATNEIRGRDPTSGANIVVGGLAVQLLGYCIFDFLAILFAFKAFPAGEPVAPPKLWNRKMKIGVIMAFISALLVLTRSCFRTGEMAEGWIGPVAQKEWLYYVFDATPVSAAVLILAIWHPSFYLP